MTFYGACVVWYVVALSNLAMMTFLCDVNFNSIHNYDYIFERNKALYATHEHKTSTRRACKMKQG